MTEKDDPWWDCPKCGATTDLTENSEGAVVGRECPECDWSVEVPPKGAADA